MEHIENNNNVLLVWDNSFDPTVVNVDQIKETKNATIRFENAERLTSGAFIEPQRHLKNMLFLHSSRYFNTQIPIPSRHLI